MWEDASKPRWEDVIAAAVEAGIARIHTTIPAVVVSYDSTTQKAAVRPSVRSRVHNPVTGVLEPSQTQPPVIPNVPVVWTSGQGRGKAITHPLIPGDPVTVLFTERSIDELKATGNFDNTPQDARRFAYSDAVAFVGGPRGFNPSGQNKPLPSAAVDASAMVIYSSSSAGVKLGSSSAIDAVLKGTTFNTALIAFLDAIIAGTNPNIVEVQAAAAAFKATLGFNNHLSSKVLVE